MKLEITKEKVLKAASKCPTAKATLETLFPEAFESSKREKVDQILAGTWSLSAEERRIHWNKALGAGIVWRHVDKIPGKDADEKIDNVILTLAKEYGWK